MRNNEYNIINEVFNARLEDQWKALYLNKKKIQNLIDIQGMTFSEPTYLDLNLVTKIVKNFKNPIKNQK
ncbi:MAG: hypothetical protein IJK62_11435 [Bacteroidales bacterium]|nr:hypothetical protein [Bacteroidales bacterium]